ncbi:hemicentin-2-like isoform X2 [Hypanus sabinus]|uniref:hemicentin-2-like isoform X2 n=1 Tax=Hypanus sabinus TaxID=79690 RepID=UPI0028C4E51F|nr:hemicentin-2-like isoform X2 [Hypanus sabinus]
MLDLRTIGKVYFLLPLLQAAVSNEWRAETPSDVTAQRGLCARIPCHYHYPSNVDKSSWTGIWYNSDNSKSGPIVFHSSDHSQEMQKFQSRTRLSGDLKDGDCSLVIDNITEEDKGPYFFRIEFDRRNRYNYLPVTQLRVSDFTDKPTIFAAELVEGKSVNIKCVFNTTCNGTSPTLTWVTPMDVPPSVSSSVTQWHNTLTYTSVLTMTPALKHHGQSLTCRVRYPSVSSEQTLTLTVQYAPQDFSITSPNSVNNSWVNMKEGIPTSILCSVQSFPVSNLTWRHLGVTLTTTSSSNELWLEFPQVTPQQAGDYQCVAKNKHGTAERAVTLTVEYAPQNLSITSPNNVNNSWVNIKEGIPTLILCSVQSFPVSNLMWRHLGVTLNTTSSSNELRLEFPQVTPQQAGVYQCVAENEHGTAERAITLSVEYAPQNLSITSPNNVNNSWVNMKEGTPTSILCSVQSFPASNLRWRHLGVTLNTTSSSNELWLEFPQVTPQQAGVYQCVAGNEHGTAERAITLSVEYAPQNLSITSPNNVNNSWVNMKEGTPTSILCSVQSFPASNLRWRHLGVTLNTTSSSNELWLEFPQVTPQQAGVYQCVAGNEHGTAERAITLSVEYAPQNLSITSPNNVNNSWVNMKEGTPTSILCSVQSFPASNLRWRHLGVTLNTTSSSNELWLEFPQVTPQQAGVYQCVAGNEHGTAERAITLSVEYAPQNLSITSPNNVNNSWVNMKEGTPTSILCSVQSFPASNLRWRHLGVTLNTTSSSNELWLEFPQVTPQQAGVYQCVAGNEHGTAERAITLSVEYAPQNLSITSPNNVNNSWVNMKEGTPTSILCSVQSFPASNLRWRHLGVTLNTTSSSNELWLEFPQVTPQQAGVYQCVAGNEHGTAERAITLSVEYAPQNLSITSPNNVNNSWVNMKEGTPTSILCSVQSFPASNLRWRHLGVTLNTTSSSNELWLEFPQVTPQQAGVYQCVAGNEHGTAERAITLSVEYAPQNLSITSPNNVNNSWVNMKEGTPTSILCSVQSFPASNLRWRHLGVTLNTTSSSNELWLEFPQVTPQQAGVYQCVAGNEHGTAERAITLSVEYAPQNLSITSPNNVNNSWVNMKEGIPTSILCSVQSFPVSNLTWRHLGVTLSTTSSSNELWLEFPQVTPQQAGVYQCVAENEHGTVERAITLSVEYKPEISRDSGCTRTSDVITCVCAARSNPPGELTWHLPLASLSGNQTHGRFQMWQVADGQLVTGSLKLGVGEGEENVTAFCTVRNQHGEAMFAVSLWMKGGVSTVWIAVLLTSSVILSMLLAGFFISRCIPKRDARTKETALEILDSTISSTAHLTAPQDTERQRRIRIPKEVSPVLPVGEGEECGPVYASLRELPGGGGPVRRGETVTYAELHFQSVGPA